MCWYCGFAVKDEEPIGRSLKCDDCGKDLRSCRNCRFYLPKSIGSCAESHAESQYETERGNFCDWYKLNPAFRVVTSGEKGAQDKADSARKAFDNLFS
jgi:hypothetical protein